MILSSIDRFLIRPYLLQMVLDKLIIRERKITARKRDSEILSELRKPQEDSEIPNKKDLPDFERLPGLKLTGQALADLLMVFEFLHNFGETLGFGKKFLNRKPRMKFLIDCVSANSDMDSLPSLQNLHLALTSEDAAEAEEELLSVISHLLVCAIEDPGIPNPVRHTTLLGQSLRSADITNSNISEILRIYLYAVATGEVRTLNGVTLDRERERRIADHHQIDSEVLLNTGKNREYYECLQQNRTWKLSECLKDKPFSALNPTTKAEVLAHLCNDLLMNKAVIKQIESSIDAVAQHKRERYTLENRVRKYKHMHARKVRMEQFEKQQQLAKQIAAQQAAALAEAQAKAAVEAAAAAAAKAANETKEPTEGEDAADGEAETKLSNDEPENDVVEVNHKEEATPNNEEVETPTKQNQNDETKLLATPTKIDENTSTSITETPTKCTATLNNGISTPDLTMIGKKLSTKDVTVDGSSIEVADDDISDIESEGTILEDDEDNRMTADDLYKKLEKILKTAQQNQQQLEQSQNSLRSTCFGQDRYWRRYWHLPTAGGIFVEGLESAQPEILKYHAKLEEMAKAKVDADMTKEENDKRRRGKKRKMSSGENDEREDDDRKDNEEAENDGDDECDEDDENDGDEEIDDAPTDERRKDARETVDDNTAVDSEQSEDENAEENEKVDAMETDEPEERRENGEKIDDETANGDENNDTEMVTEDESKDDEMTDIEDSIPKSVIEDSTKSDENRTKTIDDVQNDKEPLATENNGVDIESKGEQNDSNCDNNGKVKMENGNDATSNSDDVVKQERIDDDDDDDCVEVTTKPDEINVNDAAVVDTKSSISVDANALNESNGNSIKIEIKNETIDEIIEEPILEKWFSIANREIQLTSCETQIPFSSQAAYSNITCDMVLQCQGNRWDIANNVNYFHIPVEGPTNLQINRTSILTQSGLDEEMMETVIKGEIDAAQETEPDIKSEMNSEQPMNESADNGGSCDIDQKEQLLVGGECIKVEPETQPFQLPAFLSNSFANISAFVACDNHVPLQMTPEEHVMLEEVKRSGMPKQLDSNYVPKLLSHGWWKINDMDTLNELIQALHVKGVRERELRMNLLQALNENIDVSTPCPVANLRSPPPQKGYVDPEPLNAWNPAIARRVELALLDQVESLEDKIASASMQMKGWTAPARDPESENELDLVTGINMIRERILGLEAAIERRYLKPPLGTSTAEPTIAQVTTQSVTLSSTREITTTITTTQPAPINDDQNSSAGSVATTPEREVLPKGKINFDISNS